MLSYRQNSSSHEVKGRRCEERGTVPKNRWGDWGLTRMVQVAAPFGMIECGPVRIGHKRGGGAALNYFAGLDVSLEGSQSLPCLLPAQWRSTWAHY
jgi:hypothetical protein